MHFTKSRNFPSKTRAISNFSKITRVIYPKILPAQTCDYWLSHQTNKDFVLKLISFNSGQLQNNTVNCVMLIIMNGVIIIQNTENSPVWHLKLLNIPSLSHSVTHAVTVNPFHLACVLLYSLKTSENHSFSDVFRGYRKRPVARNRFMKILLMITLHKKWSSPLRIFSVNVTTSAGNCGFGHSYWRNP